MTTPFDELDDDLATGGVEAALDRLADRLRRDGRFHELFDARLISLRHRLGLPLILTTPLDDLDEPLRGRVEEAYLEACREVGGLLLEAGKVREAWMYLRPAGQVEPAAKALKQIESTQENAAELIGLALHEGIAPAHGYSLVLKHYGTCNAITTFDGEVSRHGRRVQQEAAALLIRHLHDELLENVRAHIGRLEGTPPAGDRLAPLLAGRDVLFENDNYHLDTSHLQAAVRIARIVEDPAVLELAWDLTDYGRRLSKQYQFAGEEPFVDLYPASGLFFAASLGRQVEPALEHFRAAAERADIHEQGPAAVETYLVLLARLRRFDAAIEESVRLIPRDARLSGFAPTLFELASLAGDYRRLLTVARDRDDLLSYTAALVSAQRVERIG